ncbi:ExbD/TolR family protein [Pararhodobacter oceanensis]|uniref:ExbD/TolR family protein n=1 Tax=Pararhodobacter oceanensis TaxID=2172121 RepID=UPI001F0C40D0|nr:biopolymer transporter ExbD [Pararhodobacter oceanensis]
MGPTSRLTPPTRRKPLSLTSLIDVIFLLLLFFMLTSSFTRFGEVELLSEGSGAGAASGQAPVFVQLAPEELRVNADPLSLEALRDGLSARAGDGGLVLISLAEGVTAQRLVDVLTVLRGAEFSVRVLS